MAETRPLDPRYGAGVAAIQDLDLRPATPAQQNDWVESKEREWTDELTKVMAEKDTLQVASIQVLTKRNAEANERIQQLEALVDKKDERIERLVDIVIEKLGGFDAS